MGSDSGSRLALRHTCAVRTRSQCLAYYCLLPIILLCLKYLFHSAHDGGLDFVQSIHPLFYARSVDRVDLELRFFRLGDKLRIFQYPLMKASSSTKRLSRINDTSESRDHGAPSSGATTRTRSGVDHELEDGVGTD